VICLAPPPFKGGVKSGMVYRWWGVYKPGWTFITRVYLTRAEVAIIREEQDEFFLISGEYPPFYLIMEVK